MRALLALALGLTLCASAHALPQDRTFSLQLWHPAPGNGEFISVEQAKPLHHLEWSVGLFFDYGRNELSIQGYDPFTNKATGARSNLVANAVGMEAWAALGLFNRFQLALSLPMTLYQNGHNFDDANPVPSGTHIAAPNGYAFGDPRLYLKARLYGKEKGFELALSHWLSFPFGNDREFGGERHFTGFSGEGRVLAGWEAGRFRAGVFLGFLWRAHESHFFGTTVGQQLTYGGAFAYDVMKQRITLVAELWGRNALGTSLNESPLELDVAAKVRIYTSLWANVGVGNGIVAGLGSPQPRVFLGFVYAPSNVDRDHDGVPDERDACPDQPEDRDGWKDSDGCPDLDNDGDTILDTEDKCPNQPEDFDEFQDDDGCPDPDNDSDGIPDIHDDCPNDPEDHKPPRPDDGCPAGKTDADNDGVVDALDKCPKDPEDKDGFQDEDGCPDPDNDGDDVPDSFDQCPNAPEDVDGWEDDDGCPDPDNDHDGVPDKLDKCPTDPETINGFQDDDGCPDSGPPPKAKLEGQQVVLVDKVTFDKGAIKPSSFGMLDQAAQIIRGHADVKIRIEAFTNADAAAVRAYLVTKGIEPERLIAAGNGDAKPSDEKKSAREASRRVELQVIEPEKPEKAEPKPN